MQTKRNAELEDVWVNRLMPLGRDVSLQSISLLEHKTYISSCHGSLCCSYTRRSGNECIDHFSFQHLLSVLYNANHIKQLSQHFVSSCICRAAVQGNSKCSCNK